MSKNIEEKERVLFTFAGGTDPTRGMHDGPILHICRYFKPSKIYLVLTKEMAGRDEKPYNIYERAIELNLKDYKPEIIRINTEIEDAHLFDCYFEPLKETFDRIKKENGDIEVLVNLTSGTPQMTTNLITYIIDSDMNLKGIQVPTPEGRQNKEPPVSKNYNVELEAESNIDNESPTHRIVFPDLKRYSRILVRNQIQELLKQYNYNAILELLKRNVFEKTTELNTLVNFAIDRKNLKGLEANKKLQFLNDKKYDKIYYYTKDKSAFIVKEWYKIVDYFALANIKQKSGDIAGYILMIEPLIVNIYLSIIENILSIKLENIFEKIKKDGYDDYKIKISKFEDGLKTYINESGELEGKIKNGNISQKVLVLIIKYYLKENKITKINSDYIDNFSEMFSKVKKIRNDVAHSLIQISKKDFEEEINIEQINAKIINFFKKYYTEFGYKESMIFVYDEINKFINEILEQEK